MSENMVNITAMSKSYRVGSVLIESLPQVDLHLHRGEAIIIKGPNGCGKSTLLKILATLIRPSTGQGLIAGESIRRHPHKIRKKIAFIPEQLQFDYHLTGTRMFKLMKALRGVSGDSHSKFVELSSRLGVKKWLDTPLGSYSTGMKKRYAVAMWLALNPELLLLDELDASLDQQALGLIADLIIQIDAERPLTIVSVSHLESFGLGKKAELIEFNTLLSKSTSKLKEED